MNKPLILIAGTAVVVVALFLIFGKGPQFGAVTIPNSSTRTAATGTTVSITTAATLVSATSSRSWFRIQNISATSSASCVFTSLTAGMVSGAGIFLNISSTPASVFDSGVSGVNYYGPIYCIGSGIGSISYYQY